MRRPWEKLIVALDTDSPYQIKRAIEVLSPKVKKFKVGLIAYCRMGPKVLNAVNKRGGEVFLDFKLYDIPNTMVETAKNFADWNVWAFTVHIKSGKKNLGILKESLSSYCGRIKKRRPLIIGVTELTSVKSSRRKILDLATKAKEAGIDGVVCSVWEAKQIKETLGLITITPGIREKKGEDDQQRVATVKEAVREKADYFVVGRPIIKEKDYLKAASKILSF